MLLKILFWLLIAVDVAALGLFFVLGLAAAGSSRTSPLSVGAFMLVVPGLVLAISIVVFVAAKSKLARTAAFLTAAAPLLFVVFSQLWAQWEFQQHQGENGQFYQFRPGPMRDVENAILKNDAAAVAAAARSADLNQKGLDGSNVLVVALRQLEKKPGPPDAVRALLKAGANPNTSGGYSSLPLTVAIQVSSKAGPEPVRLLLEAGADPNAREQFGAPVFFSGSGIRAHPDVLPLLLDRGADLKATDSKGQSVLLYATLAQNWRAARVLVDRGIDRKTFRTLDGQGFLQKLESEARVFGGKPELMDLIRHVKELEQAGR